MADPEFALAARRHLSDAEHLCAVGRLPNADHLGGFAAECGLKALAVEVLGGRIGEGWARHPLTDDPIKSHMGRRGQLWTEITSLAAGRQEPEIMALFTATDPFQDWDVSDRYSDGTHLNNAVVSNHLESARLVIRALEAALISGVGGSAA